MSQVGERHRRVVAVCGGLCEECAEYRTRRCRGCGDKARSIRQGECGVFRCCVLERGLDHCGLCLDFPCQLFWGHASSLEVVRRYRDLLERRESQCPAE